MTTATTPIDQTTADALAGPWQAVLAYREGFPLTIEEFNSDGVDPDDVRIQIVRGTAAPANYHGNLRLPGCFQSADKLVEFDDFEEDEEVAACWARAQAMVVGLNMAAAEAGR